MGYTINLNDTSPAALAGKKNIKWQKGAVPADPSLPVPVSAYVDAVSVIGITIDGGSSAPTTGSKGFVKVPFACTITKWTLLADQSGAIQLTVKKCAIGSFPTTASVVGSSHPLLSAQQSNSDSVLSGWTVSISADDVLEFVVDSVGGLNRVTLELEVTRL